MARPRKTEPRDRQFNLSLTAAEYEGIARRAEALGMRPVHFGRAVLLDNPRSSRGAPLTQSDNGWRLIQLQLSRLGNNLNQLVRRLHQTGEALPPDLEPLLKDIRGLIASVRK